MSGVFRLGSRQSRLAVWQAERVQFLLQQQGITTELCFIKSEGDRDTTTPLYEMGVQGIFTKALDVALLNRQIDLAVHSLKDVPTRLAAGLVIAAVPERGNPRDVLVYKEAPSTVDPERPYTLATSSLRRKAQWLHRYPTHFTEPLRGNLHTRMEKLMHTPHWNGALFAAAGLERIDLPCPNLLELDWMLPAPAQGALAVVCRQDDLALVEVCRSINDPVVERCVSVERMFLKALMGGCSMPIAGYARPHQGKLLLAANLLTADGRQKVDISMEFELDEVPEAGKLAANRLLENGGKAIMETFKK